MIALPVNPENKSIASLFPSATASYEFYNGSYKHADIVKPGCGYWLKIPSQKTFYITGTPLKQMSSDYKNGWQMIGGWSYPTKIISRSTGEKVSIYEYTGGQYQTVSEVKPGVGYWLKVQDDEVMMIINKD